MAGFELTTLTRRRSREVRIGYDDNDDDDISSSSSESNSSMESFLSASSSSSSSAASSESSYHYDSDNEPDDDDNNGGGEYGYYNVGGGFLLRRHQRRRSIKSWARMSFYAVRTYCRSRQAKSLLFGLLPLGLFLYIWDVTIHSGKHTTAIDSYPSHFATNGLHTSVTTDGGLRWNSTARSGHGEEAPAVGLWIYGSTWHGEIPQWHESLAKVLSMAESLNAVFVKPAISGTKLVRCDEEGLGTLLELSEVYNHTLLVDHYPKLASCAQYRKAINQLTLPKIFDICLDSTGGTGVGCSLKLGSDSGSCHGLHECPALDRAIDYSQQNPSTMVLVQLHDIWSSSLHPQLSRVVRTKQGVMTRKFSTPLLTSFEDFANVRLVFASPQFAHLEQALVRNMGAASAESEPLAFGVVHWRAGKKHLENSECARDVVVASEAMGLPSGTPFFLLSSLSEAWANNGSVEEAAAAFSTDEALTFLLDEHGFLSTKRLLPNLGDPIHYLVLDLLLAERAASFATCLEACQRRSYHFCSPCNNDAASREFTEFALHRRSLFQIPPPQSSSSSSPDTLACWPQDSSDRMGVSRLWKDHGVG